MHYPFQTSPYVQASMAQAIQALMSGAPLPSNCVVMTIPIQQAHQLFPQIMMAAANAGGGALMLPPPQGYYGQPMQPQLPPFMDNRYSRALLPQPNYYPQMHEQNYNYPMVPYSDYSGSTIKNKRRGKRNRKQQSGQPHSNVYNSSSFDTDMRNLSWSRLFDHQHNSKHHKKDPAAIAYEKNGKKPPTGSAKSASSSSSSGSASTTSDETIRRVNVAAKQSFKQQTKSSLPFKYSSEFIPGTLKQQLPERKSSKTSSTGNNRKEEKVKSDDVFIVKKPPPAPPQ